MSDFVMSIVNEVIHPKETMNTNRSDEYKLAQEPGRPNYQRENARKRLMVYDILPEQHMKGGKAEEVVSGPMLKGRKAEEVVSELMMKGMEADSCLKVNQPVVTGAGADFGSRDESFLSFAINENPILQRLSGFPYTTMEAACIGRQENCCISQLFAIDGILRQFPSIDFTVKWSINRWEAFEFRSVGSLETIRTIETLLKQSCTCENGLRLVKQPTPYLQKALNYSAAAIGTVEGVSYIKLLPQILEYFRQHTESMVECRALGSYLLLGGQPSEVETVLQSLKQ